MKQFIDRLVGIGYSEQEAVKLYLYHRDNESIFTLYKHIRIKESES